MKHTCNYCIGKYRKIFDSCQLAAKKSVFARRRTCHHVSDFPSTSNIEDSHSLHPTLKLPMDRCKSMDGFLKFPMAGCRVLNKFDFKTLLLAYCGGTPRFAPASSGARKPSIPFGPVHLDLSKLQKCQLNNTNLLMKEWLV